MSNVYAFAYIDSIHAGSEAHSLSVKKVGDGERVDDDEEDSENDSSEKNAGKHSELSDSMLIIRRTAEKNENAVKEVRTVTISL